MNCNWTTRKNSRSMPSRIFLDVSSLLHPNPSFNISQYVSFSSSNTRSSGTKLQHRYSPNNLFRHFYFNRLPRLWNRLPPSLDLLSCSLPLTKSRFKRFMWLHFEQYFNCLDVCTYHFHCPCSFSINSCRSVMR